MNISACIVGIDNWEAYTLPLIQSLQQHEPACRLVAIDNDSATPYPETDSVLLQRTPRLCYAAALNAAARLAGPSDWYIFIANDILCSGPFSDMLRGVPPGCMVGLGIYELIHYHFVSGYCMVVPGHLWNEIGEFDEKFQLSAWEDCDYAYRVQLAGYRLLAIPDLPFVHLDQRQRQTLTDIGRLHVFNGAYFERKHHIPAPLCRYSATTLIADRWG